MTLESDLRNRENGYRTVLDHQGSEYTVTVMNARHEDGAVIKIKPDPLGRDGHPETVGHVVGDELHCHGATVDGGDGVTRWDEAVGEVVRGG